MKIETKVDMGNFAVMDACPGIVVLSAVQYTS